MNLQREKMNNKDHAFPIRKSPKRAVRRSQTERKTKRKDAWVYDDVAEAMVRRLAIQHFMRRPETDRRPEIDWRCENDL